jgi:hypothetical protein
MRLKLDENLPAELADDLRALGHSVDSVVSEGLAGKPDLAVVRAARRAKRVLLTLDKGLGDVRRFPPNTHAGLVVFRLSRSGREHTRRTVLGALPRIDRLRPLVGRLLIVTESTVRGRR